MTIIPFGCSHMQGILEGVKEFNGPLSDELFKSEMAGIVGGNSNQKIIEDVYRFSNKYQLDSKFHRPFDDGIKFFTPTLTSDKINLDDTVFYIQTTYTNRLWLPTTLDSHTSSFHTISLNDSLLYINNAFAKKELSKFYEMYIKYFWNHYLNLLDLLQKIDMLQTYLKSKNIPFVHMFWSFSGNDNEWQGYDIAEECDRDLSNVKEQINDILTRIEFVKPYGCNTVTDWTNNLVTKQDINQVFQKDELHITKSLSYQLFKDVIYPECNLKISL
jgi:hypothetical protein|tara:strand:- start:825 stop:1643 length:819 start_codon:yes stop_codon:yes gene_type:complete